MILWSKNQEKLFFIKSQESVSIDQLFFLDNNGKYIAYWPKGYRGVKSTLQSRNSLIGKYCENWAGNLFKSLIEDEYYVIKQAIVPSLGITSKSPADIVIANKNKKILKASDVKIIFEIKMSLVWNWQYDEKTGIIKEIGDLRTHQGKPSFTRSDSVLKAIGKGIDIRVSNFNSSKIPIIVIGNAPLSNGFCKKADYLKSAGIIQGFWSLNPFPLNHGNTRKTTPKNGFVKMNNTDELKENLNQLFTSDLNFFSGMASPESIGKFIEVANLEDSYENKGLKFLNLVKRS